MYIKKIFNTVLIFCFFLSPSFSLAASCSKDGYTVFFLNGVWNKDEKAVSDNAMSLAGLYQDIKDKTLNSEEIKFDHLYNPSHLGGAGDVLAAGVQKSAESLGLYLNDVDLIGVQNQIAEKLQTQKFIIVSHSQGNLYANAFVSSSGLANSPSFKIYPVASPASYNAASFNNLYTTSVNDKVIVGGV